MSEEKNLGVSRWCICETGTCIGCLIEDLVAQYYGEQGHRYLMRHIRAGASAHVVLHVGRSWNGPGDIEAQCPCRKAPCGLVDITDRHPDCGQHSLGNAKTFRTVHSADECPGAAQSQESR